MDRPDLSKLEETVIASLWADVEIQKILCNTVRELRVTLEEIKNKALDDNFIAEMKKNVKDRTKTEFSVYSVCNDVLI